MVRSSRRENRTKRCDSQRCRKERSNGSKRCNCYNGAVGMAMKAIGDNGNHEAGKCNKGLKMIEKIN